VSAIAPSFESPLESAESIISFFEGLTQGADVNYLMCGGYSLGSEYSLCGERSPSGEWSEYVRERW
jgi:hypothetical protein